MVLKITFTSLGDLPWMLQFFTHMRNCVMGATSMLSIKLTQSGRKLYHRIGYKLQYGGGHSVDTITYDDNYVLNEF